MLDEAREEICHHQEWQEEVLEKLAKHDEDRGQSRQLRHAFDESAAARTKLLNQVMHSRNKYPKAQERVFGA